MDLLHRKAQSYKFSNKNNHFFAWRDFNKTFCDTSTYHKWMFKIQISSIFNYDWARQSWINGVLGVNIKNSDGILIWTLKEFLKNMPWKITLFAVFYYLLQSGLSMILFFDARCHGIMHQTTVSLTVHPVCCFSSFPIYHLGNPPLAKSFYLTILCGSHRFELYIY